MRTTLLSSFQKSTLLVVISWVDGRVVDEVLLLVVPLLLSLLSLVVTCPELT
jgi:hypothetical protein